MSCVDGLRFGGPLAAGALAAVALATSMAALAEVDLAKLEVVAQRGQTADQARRDRYECHNWAVEQSGEVPPAAAQAESDGDRAKRADRIGRILTGAVIGAGVGGIVGASDDHYHHHHDADAVIAGAAIGSAIGAATSGTKKRADEDAEQPSGYLRALTACLEGRGYSVALPSR